MQRFKTRRQGTDEVIARMLWFNRTRLHSTLAYVSRCSSKKTWKSAICVEIVAADIPRSVHDALDAETTFVVTVEDQVIPLWQHA